LLLFPVWVAVALFGHPWFAAMAFLGTVLLFLLIFLHRGKSHLLRQAIRCLVRSRQLATITVVCVTLSVAGASITLTVHDSLDGYSEMRSGSVMGSIDLVLCANGSSRETFHLSESKVLLKDLRGMENVTSADPIVLGEGPVLGGNGTGIIPNAGFMGVFDDAVVALGGFTTIDGRAVYREPDTDEAYVNSAFLAQVGVHQGDMIFLLFGNTTYPFRVSEIVAASSLGGYGGDRPFLFINMNTASMLLGQLGTGNAVAVRLGPTSDRGAALAVINEMLGDHPELPMDVTQDKAMEAYRTSSILDAPAAVLLIFGVLSLVLGMAVLNNLYRLMMEDRRQDLAVLRSLGLSRRDTVLSLMDEGLALGGLGTVLGTALGIVLSAVCLYLLRGVTIWGWGMPVLLIVDPATVMCCLLSGMASVLLIAYLSSSSVLDGHKRAGRRRSVCLILSVIPLMAALLYFTSPSLNVAIVLTLIALLLIAGHLLGGRAPLAGASMASIVLVWTILSEGVGSYGVLGSALLITGVMLAGSLMPVLLRRWSSQGARGRARARLVVAYLSHPLARLRSPLLTFSSIFVLLTVTTGLSGMVITETGKTVDQSSWALDSMAFRNGMEPFEMDLWDQVNRTQGALARENVSTMVPIFLEQASISLPPRLTAFGDTFDYAVYGLNKEALSMIDMPLSEFDQEMFSSPSEVWEQVLRGNDLAIIDSNLRYDLTISGQDDSGIRLGDVLCIHNAEGQSANVTVVGVTEQRLIGGVFVGPRLLTDFLGLSGPTLYLIDYAPGLSGMEQDRCLEQDMYSDGVITVNLVGKARSITEGMADATLAMRLLTLTGVALGAVGAIALSIRTIRDRQMDLVNLRSMGMQRNQIEMSMLTESALIASIGLVIGFLSGTTTLVGLWELYLRPMNIGPNVDWSSVVAVDVASLAILMGAFYLLFRRAAGHARASPER